MKKKFEFVAHTADAKMLVYGKTLEELFTHALEGMFSQAPAKSHKIGPERPVVVTAENVSFLLVDFLSDCLYEAERYHELYKQVRFTQLIPTHLEAYIAGMPMSGTGLAIKAVTYHDAHVEKVNGVWQATIVFDI